MLGKLVQVFYIDIDYKEARFTGVLLDDNFSKITLEGREKIIDVYKNKITTINVLYHDIWKVENNNFVRGEEVVR